jgi:hypothetical protein
MKRGVAALKKNASLRFGCQLSSSESVDEINGMCITQRSRSQKRQLALLLVVGSILLVAGNK